MALPFEVWIDQELRIIHSKPECPGARVPSKYGYLRRTRVSTVEQARQLDMSCRVCDRCRDDFTKKKDPTKQASPKKWRWRRAGATG